MSLKVTIVKKVVNSKTGKKDEFYRVRGTVQGKSKDILIPGACRKQVATKLQSLLDDLDAYLGCGQDVVPERVNDELKRMTVDPKFKDALEKLELVNFETVNVALRHNLSECIRAEEERCIAGDIVPSTVRKRKNACDTFCRYFGEEADVRAITEDDAEKFVAYCRIDRGYSQSKIQLDVKILRGYFRQFVKRKLIATNPFRDIRISVKGSQVADNRESIPAELLNIVEEYLKSEKVSDWYIYYVLVRWTGARRNESLQLKWSDIDFDKRTINMPSPKTGGNRLMPMFDDSPLYAVLMAEYLRQSSPADGYVVQGVCNLPELDRSNVNWDKVNPGTTLTKLIALAGVMPWRKLFQNLRVTRENDLLRSQEYRPEAVHYFIGHTRRTFEANYADVTGDDFIPLSKRDKGVQISKTGEGLLYSPEYSPVEGVELTRKIAKKILELQKIRDSRKQNAPTSGITQNEILRVLRDIIEDI